MAKSKLPRWVHKWYADYAWFFWLPCPLCGDYFGGHEWGVGCNHSVPDRDGSPGRGTGVCSECADKMSAPNYPKCEVCNWPYVFMRTESFAHCGCPGWKESSPADHLPDFLAGICGEVQRPTNPIYAKENKHG